LRKSKKLWYNQEYPSLSPFAAEGMMAIPPGRIEMPEVVWATLDETLEQIRTRLEGPEIDNKWRAYVLARSDDGRYAAASVFDIQPVVWEKGPAALKLSLRDLDLLQLQAGTEQDSVDLDEAEQLATQYGGYLVVLRDGRYAGLVKGRGKRPSVSLKPSDAFDLFDELLSESVLTQTEFVTVTLDTTIAEAVEALQEKDDPQAVYVVVKLDDGSFRLVDRKLDREIQNFATDAWDKPIREFESQVRPAENRVYTSLGHEQAKALAERNTLILTDEHGEAIGLMPSRRTSRRGASPPGEFDLFDKPLSHVEPDQLELPKPEFVVAALDDVIAQVASELKDLRDADNAYVIIEKDADSFGVIATQQLNQQLQSFDTGVWGKPLREVVRFLQAEQSRDFDTVGYKQTQVLVEREKTLILTHTGSPHVLLVESIKRYVVRSRQTVDIFTVPQETLDGFLTREEGAREVLPRPWETMEIVPPEAPSERVSRFINLWFEDSQKNTVERTDALVLGKMYHLALNIGKLDEALSIVDWARTPGGPRAIVEPQEKEARLFVSVFSEDFEIEKPTQELTLPPDTESETIDSETKYFLVRPVKRTFGLVDLATLDVCIYYRCNLVQSFQVEVEVLVEGEEPHTARPQSAELKAARIGKYPDLDQVPAKELSLTITKRPDGDYQFTFTLAADEEQDSRWEVVRLGCQVPLRREDLVHLITKARRQLYNISRSPAYQGNVAGTADIYQRSMKALATVGRQLYLKLFRLRDKDSSGATVAQWIADGNLKRDSKIQVVDRVGDFVFPWALVYDRSPWDSSEIDPEGFWGIRYQIELITEELVKRYRAVKPVIEAEPVSISIGLNDRIPGKDEQRAFFKELESVAPQKIKPELFTSTTRWRRALKAPTQHLIYFFCHGFTERMAADIQVNDDLIGEFKAWFNSLPKERQAELKGSITHQHALFDVSDSWLELTRGTAKLTMMEDTLLSANARFSNAPLVFLNMCESAQVLPSLSDGFIPFFIDYGARGVLGTECPMTSTFADPFARRFFRRFFQGQAIGKILMDLRREFLNLGTDQEGKPLGNPLGLAYTLYCDADIRLAAKIPMPDVIQDSIPADQNQTN
jgi:hypothetical protein